MSITVGIPSLGRAAILHETVLGLRSQSVQPEAILISVTSHSDYLPETADIPLVRILLGPKGCAAQRNTILENLRPDAGLVAFFDDDVELVPDYFENAIELLGAHPEVAGFSGLAVADGFESGEISRETARGLIQDVVGVVSPALLPMEDRTGLYGCNMVIRASVARAVGFDNRLALYAIFEDLDFGERCKPYGRIISYPACRMVHLAARSGRGSPERFGYAQITTPTYLWLKGSVPRAYLFRLLRNVVLGNLAGLIVVHRNQTRLARLRRLKGNLLAVRDFAFGGPRPERIVDIRG